MNVIKNKSGFTLVEVLLVIALAGIVATAVYTAYQSQHKSYVTQDRVSAMQQNIKSAFYFMQRDIMHAGCDPTRSTGAGVVTATRTSFRFTHDVRGAQFVDPPDGDISDPLEDITYSLYTEQGVGNLGITAVFVPDESMETRAVAENIEALSFFYLDEDGVVLDDDGNGNVTTSMPDVRSVVIAVVAKTDNPDRDYSDGTAFSVTLGQLTYQVLPAQNDHYRRRMITSHVKCRNLNL